MTWHVEHRLNVIIASVPSQTAISFWQYFSKIINRVHVCQVSIRYSLKCAFAPYRSRLFSNKTSFLWKETLGPCVFGRWLKQALFTGFSLTQKKGREKKRPWWLSSLQRFSTLINVVMTPQHQYFGFMLASRPSDSLTRGAAFSETAFDLQPWIRSASHMWDKPFCRPGLKC